MAKEKFVRNKPQVGTIGHVGPDKTVLTAAMTTIMAKKNGGEAKAYDPIDVTPEEREYGITITQALFYDELYRRKNGIYINELLSVSSSINNSSSTATSTCSFFNSTNNDSGKEAICSEEVVSNKM